MKLISLSVQSIYGAISKNRTNKLCQLKFVWLLLTLLSFRTVFTDIDCIFLQIAVIETNYTQLQKKRTTYMHLL